MKRSLRLPARIAFALAPLVLLTDIAGAQGAAPASTADAAVYFISPKNNDSLRGPVTVRFGLRHMGVSPAGTDKPNTGHHHLLINSKEMLKKNDTIIADDQHIHFGGGQTETTINLAPGKHKLQLVLGDANHQALIFSDKIEIEVLAGDASAPTASSADQKQEHKH